MKTPNSISLRLLRQFDQYRILHVYHDMKMHADRIVNQGIDERTSVKSWAKVD